jgi:hypothetical protein
MSSEYQMYNSKYLKYKNKYLSFKNMIGKGKDDDEYIAAYLNEEILIKPTQKNLLEEAQKTRQTEIQELIKKESEILSNKPRKGKNKNIDNELNDELVKVRAEIKKLTNEQLKSIDEIIKIQPPDRNLTLKETLTEIQQQIQMFTGIQKQTLKELRDSITQDETRRQKKYTDANSWYSRAKQAASVVGTAGIPYARPYVQPYVDSYFSNVNPSTEYITNFSQSGNSTRQY